MIRKKQKVKITPTISQPKLISLNTFLSNQHVKQVTSDAITSARKSINNTIPNKMIFIGYLHLNLIGKYVSYK